MPTRRSGSHLRFERVGRHAMLWLLAARGDPPVLSSEALDEAGDLLKKLAADPDLRRSLVAAAAVSRRRRRLLAERAACVMNDDGASLATGVAGVRDVRTVKCLHAHVAHALAHPAYLFGTAVAAEVVDPWCDDRRCASFVAEPDS